MVSWLAHSTSDQEVKSWPGSLAVFTLKDKQIVSDKQIFSCANGTKKFFQRKNCLISVCSERQFFSDDLPVETNKLTTVQHKFTSGGQMPEDLSVQMICLSPSVKMATVLCS